MTRKQLGWGVSLLAALLAAVWVARSGSDRAHSQVGSSTAITAAPVETMTVRLEQVVQTVEVTGTVKAAFTADIAPRVMSKVAAVYVREGDPVRAGQVLVRLESADLASEVRQAEAAVAAARAALAQSRTGAVIQRTQSATRLAQAQAALSGARAQYSLVKEGARRQRKLQADEAVQQAQAGEAQAAEGVDQARAALASAQAQLSLVKEGARRQQKLQADAALREAEANLKTAQATYNRFKPLADEGVITRQRFDEITLQLEVARSQDETAKQESSLVYEGARTQEVQQAEEAVREATAALGIAQQKAREAAAAARSAVAQRDLTYEGARSQEIRQAQEQVRQAQEALRMARAATDENRIKSDNVRMLQAQVAQAVANLAAARVQLSYTTIAAPFAGVVVRRQVDPGAMASPGVPLLTLVDPSGFRLEALVPESQVEAVRLGETAPVTIDALERTVTGRIAQVVPSANPASHTFVVEAALPRVAGLSEGMFGRMSLPTGKTQGLFVPAAAVWRQESLVGVFVVENGIARKRLVTLGKEENGRAEVLSGLSDGDVVIARDVEQVADGARVIGHG